MFGMVSPTLARGGMGWWNMFATRKQLASLGKELQQMRLIVARLRQDVNRAQGQLRNMDGWGDDFIKTREVTEQDTRAFVRRELDLNVAALPQWQWSEPGDEVASDDEAEPMPDSGVRRRSDSNRGPRPALRKTER
jgi:hypothetical protein